LLFLWADGLGATTCFAWLEFAFVRVMRHWSHGLVHIEEKLVKLVSYLGDSLDQVLVFDL